jgi:hypothetical protein
LNRSLSLANRDNDIEVEKLDLVGFSVSGSCCKICNNSFPDQFPLVEHVADVPGNDRLVPLKQLRQLIQGKPDGFPLEAILQPDTTVFGAIEEELAAGLAGACNDVFHTSAPLGSHLTRRRLRIEFLQVARDFR